jgi:AcrR family transcriptional regulator
VTGQSPAEQRVIGKRVRNTRTRSGTVLSAEAIVQAALALVGEHGGGALSVRRLGAALGCDPSAIYRYFANMDALLLAVGDELIAQALAQYTPGARWKENLRSLARCTYQAYLAHPRVAALVAARVTGGEHETQVIDLVLHELLAAGFEGDDAVRLYRSFGDFILAFCATDATYTATPPETRDADLRRWSQAYGNVDEARYPSLAALAPFVLARAAMSTFESTLDLFLTALELLAPRPTAEH